MTLLQATGGKLARAAGRESRKHCAAAGAMHNCTTAAACEQVSAFLLSVLQDSLACVYPATNVIFLLQYLYLTRLECLHA